MRGDIIRAMGPIREGPLTTVANLRWKLKVLTPLDEKILDLTADDALEEEIDRADRY